MLEFLFDAYLGAGAQYGFQDPRTLEALAAYQTAHELDQKSVQAFSQAFNQQGQTAAQAAQTAVAAVEAAAPAVAAKYGLSDAAEELVTSGMVDQKVYEAEEYTLTGSALRAYGADKVSYVDYYQTRGASRAAADAADAVEAFESVVEVPAPTITRPVIVAPAPTTPAPSVTPAPVITRPIAPAVPQLPTPVSPVTPVTPTPMPQPMPQGLSNLALYGLGALAYLLLLRR
jgi:hypothetical protein